MYQSNEAELIEPIYEPKCYYTYIYLDPRKPGKYIYGIYVFDYEPIYVGKGKGPQCFRHLKQVKYKYNTQEKIMNCNQKNGINKLKMIKILHILDMGLEPIIIKFIENVTENESYSCEENLVRTIGRIDLKTGPLTNLCEGGRRGENPSLQTRQLISQMSKQNWEDEDFREKVLISRKEAEDRPEVKKQRSESAAKMWEDEDYRKKTTESIKESKKRPGATDNQRENLISLWKDPIYRENTLRNRAETVASVEWRKNHPRRITKYPPGWGRKINQLKQSIRQTCKYGLKRIGMSDDMIDFYTECEFAIFETFLTFLDLGKRTLGEYETFD